MKVICPILIICLFSCANETKKEEYVFTESEMYAFLNDVFIPKISEGDTINLYRFILASSDSILFNEVEGSISFSMEKDSIDFSLQWEKVNLKGVNFVPIKRVDSLGEYTDNKMIYPFYQVSKPIYFSEPNILVVASKINEGFDSNGLSDIHLYKRVENKWVKYN
jgi:hypothetical protein